MNASLKAMIGHGAIVMMIGMTAGFGLVMSLVGGMELIPGHIIQFGVPGGDRAWARAHVGGMLNALMVMLVAVVMQSLAVPDKPARQIRWMVIGAAYANTLFYWAALFAPNRALTFADNRFGQANVAAWIGLAPALLFAVITLIAFALLAREAFASARR